MKRKFILAVCALLTSVLLLGVLAGCNATPKRVAGSGIAAGYPTVTTTVAELDGANIVAYDGELAVVTKQDSNTNSTLTGVYNFKLCKFVVPFDAQNVDLDVDANGNVFCTEDADTGKLTYYDRTGVVLAQNVTPGTVFNAGVNFVEIGNNLYNVADGALKSQVIKGFGYDSDILLASVESDNYFYYFVSTDCLKIFSKETGSVATIIEAGDLEYNSTVDTSVFVLYGDTLILQYVDRLPDDATKYDFAESNSKYDIRHYLYDVEKNKTKEIRKFNYFIQLAKVPAVNEEYYGEYDEDIVNVLAVNKIEDKKLKTNISHLSVSDTLKVKFDFDDITERAEYAVAFGEGYIVTTNEGYNYVYSKINKFVAPLGDAAVSGKYAVVGGNIYTLEGKEMVKKASYDANTYNIVSLAGDYVLLAGVADGKYYGCNVGAQPQAFSGTVSYIADSRIYAVTDGTGAVALYSLTGTQLLNGLSSFDVQATYTGEDGKVTTLALINGSQYIVIK